MILPLLLEIAVVAAAPEGATDGTEARKVVASCQLTSLPNQLQPTTVEFVTVQRSRAVRMRGVEAMLGSGKYVTWWEFLVIPGTCRTVALRVDCVEGNPSCSAVIFHRPGKPPTDLERGVLLSWLGGGEFDSRLAAHQSARTPAIEQSRPKRSEPSEPLAENAAPSSVPVRAVALPRPLWLAGSAVPQKVSWAQTSTLAKEESYDSAGGFVSSGHTYAVHRGDCCVREDSVHPVGPSRLRIFSSPSHPSRKVSYVVLEQPRRNRSAWLVSSRGGFHLVGVHGSKAWLEVPTPMDEGFSLLAIDLDTGAAWHLVLEETPTFALGGFSPREVTEEGLLLESPGENPPQKTLPWELLERAIREAPPPTK